MSYTVDELIKYAATKPVITVELSKLKWQYPHDRISKKRIEKVTIDGYPIIVKTQPNGDLATLDGFHRAYKAIKEGRLTIQAVIITEKDIAILNKRSGSKVVTPKSFKW